VPPAVAANAPPVPRVPIDVSGTSTASGAEIESDKGPAEQPNRLRRHAIAVQMETYRLEVGATHGIKPGNIVGAIANEAGIEGVHIGRVDIREDHSYVDLPPGMPKNIFKGLQRVRVAGRELRLSRVTEKPPKPPRDPAGRHKERKLLTRR
jgi:ATP-dependent RNA helicase DeaD